MNEIMKLVHLDAPVRQERGVLHTPAEILQQPAVWRATSQVVGQHWHELSQWSKAAGAGPILLTGAGSSHYVGVALAPLLTSALGVPVMAVPSTEILFDPEGSLPRNMAGLISFARSGESPEGNAAFGLVKRHRPSAKHLVITCNAAGELARLAGQTSGAVTLLLPPETNDRSLAMTSSFTSMIVAAQALAFAGDFAPYAHHVERLASAAERTLHMYCDRIAAVAGRGLRQIMFLGSGVHLGTAMESRLKVSELTAGKVSTLHEGILGLRHGPMAALGAETAIVYYLSADPYRRRYELDLMREIEAKGLGGYRLAVAPRRDTDLAGLVDEVVEVDPDGGLDLADDFLPPAFVTVGQLLGLFLSLGCGLAPDAPSRGVIHRTVQGVTIYPFEAQG